MKFYGSTFQFDVLEFECEFCKVGLSSEEIPSKQEAEATFLEGIFLEFHFLAVQLRCWLAIRVVTHKIFS